MYGRLVDQARRTTSRPETYSRSCPATGSPAPFSQDPFALYRSLRRTNPSPFLFFLNFPTFQLVGSSIEILVRLRDGKITIRPVAGTRRRGATPAEDLALEKELLADEKERAEHLMLLDLGRNDVGRVARLRKAGRNAPPTAQARPAVRRHRAVPDPERYSHVMHIVSNVPRATLLTTSIRWTSS